eukprot:gene2239-2761_t
MNSESSSSAPESVVHFVSLGYGELRLAKKYSKKDTLEKLFQTEGGLIMVDPDGEEVIADESGTYELIDSKTYTIVSEKDLESDSEEDQCDDDINDDDLDNEYDDEDDENIQAAGDNEESTTVQFLNSSISSATNVDIDENEANHHQHQHQRQQQHQHQHQHKCKEDHCNEEHQHCCGNETTTTTTSTTTTTTTSATVDEDEEHDHDHHHGHDGDCCGSEIKNNNSNIEKLRNDHLYKKLLRMREERIKMISDLYKPLHPEIFKLNEDFFEKSFIDPIRSYRVSNDPSILLSALDKLTDTKIYSLKIFNMGFCQKLMEEIEHFKKSGLPTARPNSMNNYGVVLDEVGFVNFFREFRENYLRYYTSILFPDYYGAELDSHHSFVVQYKMDKEKELGFHFDESHLTVNLCLGTNFTGGSLYFKGILNQPETHDEYFEFNHVPGTALLHIGIHRHGAQSLTSGERTNLILWLRNTHGVSDVY